MTKVQDEGVHVLYKNLGETPWECMERFRKEDEGLAGVSMTYAGRLDPMAEGLLLVLSGESVHKKESYLGLPKTYECEILWGMETDTADILGVVSEKEVSQTLGVWETEKIAEVLEKSVGKFEQKYPAYSSKPVSGKPLFQWAREGKLGEIEIPSHEVEIFSAEFISRREISGKELLSEIIRRISLVTGDFRQTETIAKWEEIFGSHLDASFTIEKISLNVSSGFYVRQFVIDLAEEFGTSAATFHIKRTKVGSFAL